MRKRLVGIEYIGGGQYIVTNGQESHNLRLDYGVVATMQDFGMRPRHNPRCTARYSTDGTIDCSRCGRTADEFLFQAMAYLAALADSGRRIIDPGYFWEC